MEARQQCIKVIRDDVPEHLLYVVVEFLRQFQQQYVSPNEQTPLPKPRAK